MAGIEKICEYSGDYHGWKMYGWKRDHIQVCPEYRKLFRGKDCVLFWNPEPSGYREDYSAYSVCLHLFTNWIYSDKLPKCLHWIRRHSTIRVPKFWRPVYWRWKLAGEPPVYPAVPEYEYCLWCPDLPGRVAGQYCERTTNPLRTWSNLNKLVYPAKQVYDDRVWVEAGETWWEAVDRKIKELETEEETRMNYQELLDLAERKIKEHPLHKREIMDILSLARCEIDDDGSESRECDLAYDDIVGVIHVNEEAK